MKSIVVNDHLATIQQFVKQEQARRISKFYSPTLLMQSLFILVTVWVTYDLIETNLLSIWALCQAILLILRQLLMRWYIKNSPSIVMKGWVEKLTLGMVIFGSFLWGSMAFALDFALYPQESVFIIALNLGIGVGATVIGALWYRYFIVYSVPFLACFVVSFIIGVPEQSLTLAGVFIVFGVYLVRIVKMNYQNNLDNLALRKKNEILAQTTNQFIAAASHDLRQPTQALSLFISALEQSDKEIDRERLIKQLKQSSYALNELLNQILDMSKLNTQSLKTTIEPVDLTAMFFRLENTFKALADAKNLSFTTQANSLWVSTDALLLERLLANLLDNAITYTAMGKVTLLASLSDSNKVNIELTDTGEGIDADKHSDIFEPFYQIGNAARNEGKGFGLGLSIVNLISEKLGLTLSLKSALGQGTSFAVALPKCAPIVTTLETESLTQPWQLSGKTALVVDDNQSVREALASQLKAWGMIVLKSDGLDDALSLISTTSKVHVVLSDLRLENNESGMDVINRIRAHLCSPELPALLLSGDTAPDRLDEVSNAGFTLLHKPVKAAQLRSAMQREMLQANAH